MTPDERRQVRQEDCEAVCVRCFLAPPVLTDFGVLVHRWHDPEDGKEREHECFAAPIRRLMEAEA